MIEAKMNGVPVQPKQIAPPSPVHDFMAALKRSLAQEAVATAKPRRKAAADRRQTNLPLPLTGKKKDTAASATVTAPPRRRRKA